MHIKSCHKNINKKKIKIQIYAIETHGKEFLLVSFSSGEVTQDIKRKKIYLIASATYIYNTAIKIFTYTLNTQQALINVQTVAHLHVKHLRTFNLLS